MIVDQGRESTLCIRPFVRSLIFSFLSFHDRLFVFFSKLKKRLTRVSSETWSNVQSWCHFQVTRLIFSHINIFFFFSNKQETFENWNKFSRRIAQGMMKINGTERNDRDKIHSRSTRVIVSRWARVARGNFNREKPNARIEKSNRLQNQLSRIKWMSVWFKPTYSLREFLVRAYVKAAWFLFLPTECSSSWNETHDDIHEGFCFLCN